MSITSLHNHTTSCVNKRGGIPTGENDRFNVHISRDDVYEIVGLLKRDELDLREENAERDIDCQWSESLIVHHTLARTLALIVGPIASIWHEVYQHGPCILDDEQVTEILESYLPQAAIPCVLGAETSNDVNAATILASVFASALQPVE